MSFSQGNIIEIANLIMDKEYDEVLKQIDWKTFRGIPKKIKLDEDGCCYALSSKISEAFLESETGVEYLLKIMNYICNQSNKKNLFLTIKNIREEKIKQKIPLTDEEKILIEIHPLLNSLKITQDPEKFRHLFDIYKPLAQDIEKTIKLTTSYTAEKNKTTVEVAENFLRYLDKESLTKVLNLFYKIFSTIEKDFSFNLSSDDHTISVCFLPKTGWFVRDPNDLPGKTFPLENIENVVNTIFLSFKDYNENELNSFLFTLLARSSDLPTFKNNLTEMNTRKFCDSTSKNMTNLDESQRTKFVISAAYYHDFNILTFLTQSLPGLIKTSSLEGEGNMIEGLIESGSRQDVFEFLLEKEATLKKEDAIAAARNNRDDLLTLFESKGILPDIDVLNAACKNGHLLLAKNLIAKGIKPDASTLQVAIENHCEEMVNFLLDHDELIKLKSFEMESMLELAIEKANEKIAHAINNKYDLKQDPISLDEDLEAARKKILSDEILFLVKEGNFQDITALLRSNIKDKIIPILLEKKTLLECFKSWEQEEFPKYFKLLLILLTLGTDLTKLTETEINNSNKSLKKKIVSYLQNCQILQENARDMDIHLIEQNPDSEYFHAIMKCYKSGKLNVAPGNFKSLKLNEASSFLQTRGFFASHEEKAVTNNHTTFKKEQKIIKNNHKSH